MTSIYRFIAAQVDELAATALRMVQCDDWGCVVNCWWQRFALTISMTDRLIAYVRLINLMWICSVEFMCVYLADNVAVGTVNDFRFSYSTTDYFVNLCSYTNIISTSYILSASRSQKFHSVFDPYRYFKIQGLSQTLPFVKGVNWPRQFETLENADSRTWHNLFCRREHPPCQNWQ